MKIIKNIFERKDDRGVFREYINSDSVWKSINGGFMRKGSVMGNHYHKKCETMFFLVSGSVEILIKDLKKENSKIEKFTLNNNEGIIFEPYETHANVFLEDSEFILLKSEKFDRTNEDIYPAKIT